MKPRLKLGTTGRLTVVQPGECDWGTHQAWRYVQRHYGSQSNFARRWGFSTYAVSRAFSINGARTAGLVAEVRSVLGLAVEPPSARARNLAARHAQRRARLETRA